MGATAHSGSGDVLSVVGGSAGAVLAAGVSENADRNVLLLEAGPAYPLDGYPPELLNADVVGDAGHDWGYTSRGSAVSLRIPNAQGECSGPQFGGECGGGNPCAGNKAREMSELRSGGTPQSCLKFRQQ